MEKKEIKIKVQKIAKKDSADAASNIHSSPASVNKEDIELLNVFVKFFKKKYGVNSSELMQMISEEAENSIPVCIFSNDKLSVFEAIVKYLAENKSVSLKKIAKLLGKSYSTIWVTYNNSKKKLPAVFEISACKQIPISVFSDAKLTIFESLVKYLKEKEEMSNKEIGELLHRNNKTIWTIYNNAKKR